MAGGDEKKEEPAGEGEAVGEDPEVVAAREEEMQRRRDKFARMEEEREKVRKGIREKVMEITLLSTCFLL